MAYHDVVSDDDSSITKHSTTTTSSTYAAKDDPDERTPLITTTALSNEDGEEQAPPHRRSASMIILLLVAVIVLAQIGDQLMDSPQTRIMEAIICYNYYEKVDPSKLLLGRDVVGPGAVGGVAEMWCKENAVASQLADLRAYQMFLDGFPSLLLAFPFGWAADRFGRRPLVFLGVASFVVRASWIQFICFFWQTFDIRWTWASTAHGLMSGSSPCVSSLIFVMISDVVEPENRATVFLQIGAWNLTSAIVAPPVAAWLMEINPWIPCFIGTGLIFLSLFLVFPIPETLNYRHPHDTPSNSHPPSPAVESFPPPPDTVAANKIVSFDYPILLCKNLKSATVPLWADWRVPTLVLTFLVHILFAGPAIQTLLQYVSKRYSYSFAKATLVITTRSLINFVFLFLLLPYLSTYLTARFKLSGQRRDLYLTRASLILTAIGWTLIGLSPNVPFVVFSIVITSLGQGWPYTLRSFLASLIPAHHVARVYSLISVVDTVGSMLGAPLLAALFKRGLAIGGMGVGLPFYFLALAALVVVVLAFVVRLRPGEVEYMPVDQEE